MEFIGKGLFDTVHGEQNYKQRYIKFICIHNKKEEKYYLTIRKFNNRKKWVAVAVHHDDLDYEKGEEIPTCPNCQNLSVGVCDELDQMMDEIFDSIIRSTGVELFIE
jgi:hypothetical protein